MEFSSIHSSPPSSSPASSLLDNVSGNFDFFQSSAGCPYSAGIAGSSSEEANELIGGYVENKILPIAASFVSSLSGICNLAVEFGVGLYEEGRDLVEFSRYHGERIAYILKNSEGTLWDAKVWEEKLDNDTYDLALHLTSVSNVTALTELSEKEQGQIVDEAVQNLLNVLAEMPPLENAQLDDTVLSRKALTDLLSNMPQTPFVQIARGFLDKTGGPNGDSALDMKQWAIVSLLADAMLVEQNREIKRDELKVKEYLDLREKCENPDRVKDEYEKLKKEKEQGLGRPLTKTEKKELNRLVMENLELQDKRLKLALSKLEKEERARLQRQWNQEIAKSHQSLDFFAWDKLSYIHGAKYLEKLYEPEFAPNYSYTRTYNGKFGVNAGWKKVDAISAEPDAFVGFSLGLSNKSITLRTDHERYRCRVHKQIAPHLNIIGKLAWVFDTARGKVGASGSLNADITHSIGARYSEHGTSGKYVGQHFCHTVSNNIETAGHILDDLVRKHCNDPYMKQLLSRKARMGWNTDSYRDRYTRHEIENIDRAKEQFDDKEQEMKARLSLAVSSIGHADLQAAQVNVPEVINKFASGNPPNDEKVHALKKAQVKTVFKEFADSELEELRFQRDRVVADVVKDIRSIKQNEIWKMQHEVNKLNSQLRELKPQANVVEGIACDEQEAREKLEHKIKVLNLRISYKAEEFAEHQILLEQFVNDFGIAEEEEGIRLTGTDATSKKINELVEEALACLDEHHEVKRGRQRELDIKIKEKEAESWTNEFKLWKNELNVDLAFELMALKGMRAAQIRNQLVAEWKQDGWSHGFAYIFTEEQLNSNEANLEDDQKTQKIVAKYEFKLANVDKQFAITRLKKQAEIDIAEVKSDFDPRIAAKRVEFKEIDGKNIPAAEAHLTEIEDLTSERDSKIRKIEHQQQLNELQIETVFNLALVEVQSTGENPDRMKMVRKEHGAKEIKINTKFALDELKYQQGLELARNKRGWTHKSFNTEKQRERDKNIADMENNHAKQVRLIEKDAQLSELDNELYFATHRQTINELHVKKAYIEKQFEIDELKRAFNSKIDANEERLRMPKLKKKEEAAIKREVAKVTLALMEQRDAEIKETEDKFQLFEKETDPVLWKRFEIHRAFDKIINAKKKEIKELKDKRDDPLLVLTINDENPERSEFLHKHNINSEINIKEVELLIDELKVELLLTLLSMENPIAVEQQNQLIEELRLDDKFLSTNLGGSYFPTDEEEKTKKIIAKYELKLVEQNQIKVAKLRRDKNIMAAYLELGQAEAMLKESVLTTNCENEIKEIEKDFSQKMQEFNDEQAQAKQKFKEAKAAEKALEKEYSSWTPVRNNTPIRFSNTDVERNGAYLTDYRTGNASISVAGSGNFFNVASADAEASVRGTVTDLSRQKFTHFGVRFTDPLKSDEEKEGILRLIKMQLDSLVPHVRSFSEKLIFWDPPQANPMSVQDTIIEGWKELEFRFAHDPKRTEARGVTRVFNKETNQYENKPAIVFNKETNQYEKSTIGFTVSNDHFTIEQCRHYLEADIALYAKCYNHDGVVKEHEAVFLELQKRYAAKNPSEIIKHMGYLVGYLIGLAENGAQHNVVTGSTEYKKNSDISKQEVTDLQDALKAVEKKLTKLKTDKWEHWMDWGIQEYGSIQIQSVEGKFSFEAEANGPASAGLKGEGTVKWSNYDHSVASRKGEHVEISISGGMLTGSNNTLKLVPGGVDDHVTNNLGQIFDVRDIGLAEDLDKNPLEIYSGTSTSVTKTYRAYNLSTRFGAFYEELGLPLPGWNGWVPTYEWTQRTVEKKEGFNLSIPLEKMMGLPIHPSIGAGRTTTEIHTVEENFPVISFNTLDMHFSHGVDNSDMGYWINGIFIAQRPALEQLLSNLGKEQLEEDKKLTPLSNELKVRGLEFKRHPVVADKFKKFETASKQLIRVAKYFDAIKNTEANMAATEAARAAELHQVWVKSNEIRKSKQKMAAYKNEILELSITKNDQNSASIERQIQQLEQNFEKEKLKTASDKYFNQAEQMAKIHQFYDDKKALIKDTLSAAKRHFLGEGIDPNDPDQVYDYCFKFYEEWEHSYYPHVRALFINSDRHETSTVDVNGVRLSTYNNEAVNKDQKKTLKNNATKIDSRDETYYALPNLNESSSLLGPDIAMG